MTTPPQLISFTSYLITCVSLLKIQDYGMSVFTQPIMIPSFTSGV